MPWSRTGKRRLYQGRTAPSCPARRGRLSTFWTKRNRRHRGAAKPRALVSEPSAYLAPCSVSMVTVTRSSRACRRAAAGSPRRRPWSARRARAVKNAANARLLAQRDLDDRQAVRLRHLIRCACAFRHLQSPERPAGAPMPPSTRPRSVGAWAWPPPLAQNRRRRRAVGSAPHDAPCKLLRDITRFCGRGDWRRRAAAVCAQQNAFVLAFRMPLAGRSHHTRLRTRMLHSLRFGAPAARAQVCVAGRRPATAQATRLAAPAALGGARLPLRTPARRGGALVRRAPPWRWNALLR